MYNECSSELKYATKKYAITFQLAPPHMYRLNAAEQGIITCKNHFISVFSTTDPYFPIIKWDCLLSQCIITLNLIRNSRVKPDLPAYAYLHGPYGSNKSPMAPPGTHVIVHEKTGDHTPWGRHGTQGCYIGPSLHHYRCI